MIENSTADSRTRPAAEPWRPAGSIWDEGDGNPSALEAEDTAFDSRVPDHGVVAQLVERRFGRPKVRGSSPLFSTTGWAYRPPAEICEPVDVVARGASLGEATQRVR